VDASNGQNGALHVCDRGETGSHDCFEQSTLARDDSKELLRELLRRVGENPDRSRLRRESSGPGMNYSVDIVSVQKTSS
jgi:hypothetical protein